MKLEASFVQKPENVMFDPGVSFQERAMHLSKLLLSQIASAPKEERTQSIEALMELYRICKEQPQKPSSHGFFMEKIHNAALAEPLLTHLDGVLRDLKVVYQSEHPSLFVSKDLFNKPINTWESHTTPIAQSLEKAGVVGGSATDFIEGIAPVKLPAHHPLNQLAKTIAKDPEQRMPHQHEAFYAYLSKNPSDAEGLYGKWYSPKNMIDPSEQYHAARIHYEGFRELRGRIEAVVASREMSQGLSSLLLHPGVIQNMDAFVDFLKKNAAKIEEGFKKNPETLAWDTLNDFKESLGTVEVYRGMVLDEATREAIVTPQEKRDKDSSLGAGAGILPLSDLLGHRQELMENLFSPSRHHSQPGLLDYNFTRFLDDKQGGA